MNLGSSGYASDQDSQRTIRASKRKTPGASTSKRARNDIIALATARSDTPADTLVSQVNVQGTLYGSVEPQEFQIANPVGSLQQISRSSTVKTPSSEKHEGNPLNGEGLLLHHPESPTFFEKLRQNRVFGVPVITQKPKGSTTHPRESIPAPAPVSSTVCGTKESCSSTSRTVSGQELCPSSQRIASSASFSGAAEKATSEPVGSSRIKTSVYTAPRVQQAPFDGSGVPEECDLSSLSQMSRSKTVRLQSRQSQDFRASSNFENHGASRPVSSDTANKKPNRLIDHQNTRFTGVPGVPQVQPTVQSQNMSNGQLVVVPEQRYSVHWDAEGGFIPWRGTLWLSDLPVNPLLCETAIQFRSFVPNCIRGVESQYNPELFVTYRSSNATPFDDLFMKITTGPWERFSGGWYKHFVVPLPVNMFRNRESRCFITRAQVTYNNGIRLTSPTELAFVELLQGSREMVFHPPPKQTVQEDLLGGAFNDTSGEDTESNFDY